MESDDTRRTLTPLLWCATCLANLVQRCTCAPPSRARAKGQEAGIGGEGGKHVGRKPRLRFRGADGDELDEVVPRREALHAQAEGGARRQVRLMDVDHHKGLWRLLLDRGDKVVLRELRDATVCAPRRCGSAELSESRLPNPAERIAVV